MFPVWEGRSNINTPTDYFIWAFQMLLNIWTHQDYSFSTWYTFLRPRTSDNMLSMHWMLSFHHWMLRATRKIIRIFSFSPVFYLPLYSSEINLAFSLVRLLRTHIMMDRYTKFELCKENRFRLSPIYTRIQVCQVSVALVTQCTDFLLEIGIFQLR